MDYIEEIKQLREQLLFNLKIEIPDNIENIVIAGMGGSGIAGRIFKEIYDKKPVITVDNYDIPKFVNNKTLFIAVSYSGNTEETITALRKARIKGAIIRAITSGGKLEKEVDDAIIIPKGLQPRSAIGYLTVPLLRGAGFKGTDFDEAAKYVKKIDEKTNEYEEIAEDIWKGRKTPVIFGTPPFRELAYRWKTQFNENSKIISYWSYFPELNHNDTMALENDYRKEQFYFFVLNSKFADKKILDRIRITSNLCKVNFKIIEGEGNSIISQLFTLIHKGDYISYYVARKRNIDPRDVSIIEKLKKELEESDTNK
jgi:glucose/mannose-6-phosphate isomerase